MAEPLLEAGEPPRVEMFGVLELVLSLSNAHRLQGRLQAEGPQEEAFPGQDLQDVAQRFYQSWQICHGTHSSGGGGTGTIGWHRGLTKPG